MNRQLTATEATEVAAIRDRIAADITAAWPIGATLVVGGGKPTSYEALNDSVLGLVRFRVGIALWDRLTDGRPCEYWSVELLHRECRTAKAIGHGYTVGQALEAMGSHLRAQDAAWAAAQGWAE